MSPANGRQKRAARLLCTVNVQLHVQSMYPVNVHSTAIFAESARFGLEKLENELLKLEPTTKARSCDKNQMLQIVLLVFSRLLSNLDHTNRPLYRANVQMNTRQSSSETADPSPGRFRMGTCTKAALK